MHKNGIKKMGLEIFRQCLETTRRPTYTNGRSAKRGTNRIELASRGRLRTEDPRASKAGRNNVAPKIKSNLDDLHRPQYIPVSSVCPLLANDEGIQLNTQKGPNNQWISDADSIAQAFLTRFNQLYTSSNPIHDQAFAGLFHPTLSEEDKKFLCALPDRLEVQQAIFAIGAKKQPGSNSMPALFYQRYWSILGEDVTKADQSIVNKKSPFLFLLATEALSRLLAKEEALGNIHGIKMNGGGPSFTRLLFANDLFLFPKATDYNLRAIFSHLETCQR